MPYFSDSSKEQLQTCHKHLQLLLNQAINIYDFKVLEGHRGKNRQNKLYNEGKTQLLYPKSKHNKEPSLAVDVAPYPIDWEGRGRFVFLAGIMTTVWYQLKRENHVHHTLRWGGNWDGDVHLDDNKFDDLGHYELV